MAKISDYVRRVLVKNDNSNGIKLYSLESLKNESTRNLFLAALESKIDKDNELENKSFPSATLNAIKSQVGKEGIDLSQYFLVRSRSNNTKLSFFTVKHKDNIDEDIQKADKYDSKSCNDSTNAPFIANHKAQYQMDQVEIEEADYQNKYNLFQLPKKRQIEATDINMHIEKNGNTQLHNAAKSANRNQIFDLINAGANPSITNFNGELPEDLASSRTQKKLLTITRNVFDSYQNFITILNNCQQIRNPLKYYPLKEEYKQYLNRHLAAFYTQKTKFPLEKILKGLDFAKSTHLDQALLIALRQKLIDIDKLLKTRETLAFIKERKVFLKNSEILSIVFASYLIYIKNIPCKIAAVRQSLTEDADARGHAYVALNYDKLETLPADSYALVVDLLYKSLYFPKRQLRKQPWGSTWHLKDFRKSHPHFPILLNNSFSAQWNRSTVKTGEQISSTVAIEKDQILTFAQKNFGPEIRSLLICEQEVTEDIINYLTSIFNAKDDFSFVGLPSPSGIIA